MTEANKKILCIIPARGGSKRFPGKNIALLNGKPLIAYTIEAALKAAVFGRVVVSTENTEIAEVSGRYDAEVLERPEALAGDNVRVPEVALHVLDSLEKRGEKYDILCILQPTCPLRTADDITAALEKFRKSSADYLLSTTNCSPLFRALKENTSGFLEPVFGKKFLTREQDIPAMQVPNGCIIIAKVAAFRKNRDYYGERLIGYMMPQERSVDIDVPEQRKLALFYMTNK